MPAFQSVGVSTKFFHVPASAPPGTLEKNATGTFRICKSCCRRLALTRFFHFRISQNLLKCQIERVGQRVLGQPQHFSAHPHPISAKLVDMFWPLPVRCMRMSRQ
jgi:hypothetical protein